MTGKGAVDPSAEPVPSGVEGLRVGSVDGSGQGRGDGRGGRAGDGEVLSPSRVSTSSIVSTMRSPLGSTLSIPPAPAAPPIISVRDLRLSAAGEHRPVRILRGIELDIPSGRSIGFVGESGSGKTLTALAIMGLAGHGGVTVDAGEIVFDGRAMHTMNTKERREIVGSEIAMVFQDPMTALDPLYRVSSTIEETARAHAGSAQELAEILARAREVFASLMLTPYERITASYPFELSGGQRQRVMIALALMLRPRVIIFDEPTTALDATVQVQILSLIGDVRAAHPEMSIIFISHDIHLIRAVSDTVHVFYAGQIVETMDSATIMTGARHPYTLGLIGSLPVPGRTRLTPIPGRLDISSIPDGTCVFFDRCERADEGCRTDIPVTDLESGHTVRCRKA